MTHFADPAFLFPFTDHALALSCPVSLVFLAANLFYLARSRHFWEKLQFQCRLPDVGGTTTSGLPSERSRAARER